MTENTQSITDKTFSYVFKLPVVLIQSLLLFALYFDFKHDLNTVFFCVWQRFMMSTNFYFLCNQHDNVIHTTYIEMLNEYEAADNSHNLENVNS